jgi:hypothetical protein
VNKAKRERLRRERADLERASLDHRDVESYERDGRVGARLLRADGSVLCERVKTPPSRRSSFATWSVVPSSARVASPRPNVPGWS